MTKLQSGHHNTRIVRLLPLPNLSVAEGAGGSAKFYVDLVESLSFAVRVRLAFVRNKVALDGYLCKGFVIFGHGLCLAFVNSRKIDAVFLIDMYTICIMKA